MVTSTCSTDFWIRSIWKETAYKSCLLLAAVVVSALIVLDLTDNTLNTNITCNESMPPIIIQFFYSTLSYSIQIRSFKLF